jgi:GTPase
VSVPADVGTISRKKCGFVAIVGRPNVGKSTLLNKMLGQKVSITSKKPQTTRHQISGIKSTAEYQIIFIDTPGLHKKEKKALNRALNKAAGSALRDADIVILVTDRNRWTDEDEFVLSKVSTSRALKFLAVNKIDRLENKDLLLPAIAKIQSVCEFAEVVPLSAINGTNLKALEKLLVDALPSGPFMFPDDQITDRSERFMATEIVREKLMRQLGNELPYDVAVEIEQFSEEGRMLRIHALILVDRESQKKIVICQQGAKLKRIGTDARKDMEILFDNKVMLNLWVKVKSGWSDNERALQSLGYSDSNN